MGNELYITKSKGNLWVCKETGGTVTLTKVDGHGEYRKGCASINTMYKQ